MIISHKYKYLFVELPHTASTAISYELCNYYGGEPILHKHAHYSEFLRIADRGERHYFTFAGIRNPLDVTVTVYFKRKTNHQGFYTDPKHWRKNGGHVSERALREFRFIRDHDADFAAYFQRFYRLPYDSWGSPAPCDFDFVIRYERLQEDFGTLLARLGIEQVRPLPLINRTKGKNQDFFSYYISEIQGRAVRVFGPYMKVWGYSFPASWGPAVMPWDSWVLFWILRVARKLRSRDWPAIKSSIYNNFRLKGFS